MTDQPVFMTAAEIMEWRLLLSRSGNRQEDK